ncbi:sulfite exporter TauE/SafE family protein [Hyphomicrobium sp.]|uniref:sulfite exporter TauE/SafE family protein n=1 Tax=Hyphomicrobium sp. TaxID=82 RepID=UPI001D460B7C|nr:sulfite exporter TauE/SafE family protein [Hyphomicrobium sp.]MBY0559410.1 sulfite exporter TauE/SafE family protein [Hyphomicrobium sp.]
MPAAISMEYLIALLALLAVAGLLAGFLSGLLGIGGGGVLVPVLYEAFGVVGVPEDVRMHVTLGTTLGVIAPTVFRSFSAFRARGTVDIDVVKRMGPWIVLGVIAGSVIAHYASSEALRWIWVVFGTALAAKMFLGRDDWKIADKLPRPPWLSTSGGAVLEAGKNAGSAIGVGREIGGAIDSLKSSGIFDQSVSLLRVILKPFAIVIWVGRSRDHVPAKDTRRVCGGLRTALPLARRQRTPSVCSSIRLTQKPEASVEMMVRATAPYRSPLILVRILECRPYYPYAITPRHTLKTTRRLGLFGGYYGHHFRVDNGGHCSGHSGFGLIGFSSSAVVFVAAVSI